jgi:tripartite-type tricarboxylate transporter receptor subunit TctC
MRGDRLAAAAAMLLAALGAHAQSAGYPERTVRIVVPFAAGGGTDVQARVAAARLAARFKQAVIVENRGGAGGNIGTAAAAQSPADGYTLLFVTPATVINQSLYAKPGYSVRDFAAVGSWATSPLLIIAATGVPANDLKSLVAYSKANPGKLSFASGGVGLITHLVMEFFKLDAGIDLLHVPYTGQGPALAAVAGGQVSLTADSVASSAPSVKSGRVRALATTARERSPDLKDVPTVAEAGFPELAISTWYGLVAPAQTPAGVLEALHAATNEALADPEVRAQIQKLGAEPNPTTREAFARFLDQEAARWAKVLAETKIRID